jgi:Streptomyces sporulation and cell division protein, SsgA
VPHIASVSAQVELRLVVPGGPMLPVVADLRYQAADPWAVVVTFHTGGEDGSSVEWLFARQLLTDGVHGPVGDGDVRVAPAFGDSGPAVHLAMSSPSGSALFEVDLGVLIEFLQQTYAAVPTGAEELAVDLDAELAALLSR